MTGAAFSSIRDVGDFFVPTFVVRLANRELADDVVHDILQVTYKDDIEAIDSFELTINNWDAETRSFKYSDESLFDPGQRLEISMGYFGSDPRKMIVGEITSLRPAFPAGAKPTLSVSGLNLLHRLRAEQVSDVYENVTDADIARRIGGRLGIQVRTVPGGQGERHEYLIQENDYDIVFLMERARRVGYDLFVDEEGESTLHFEPSTTVRNVAYHLNYGSTLQQFQPALTTANQVGEVTVVGWDNVNKKAIKETAQRSELPESQTEGLRRVASAFSERKEIIATTPVNTPAEAKELALETLRRISKDMVKASGTVVGLPDLRAGQVVRITGVGSRFSGQYFVTATTHTIGDGGYTTQFQCRMEEG